MGIIDEVREIDQQISGQLQKSALAAEVARARGQRPPSSSPSATFLGKVKGSQQTRRKIAEFFSRANGHAASVRHITPWMQPSPDAIAFIARAYATPAFLGLMQDLADYDK